METTRIQGPKAVLEPAPSVHIEFSEVEDESLIQYVLGILIRDTLRNNS